MKELNLKAKCMRDLIDDTPFTRDDIITLQAHTRSAHPPLALALGWSLGQTRTLGSAVPITFTLARAPQPATLQPVQDPSDGSRRELTKFSHVTNNLKAELTRTLSLSLTLTPHHVLGHHPRVGAVEEPRIVEHQVDVRPQLLQVGVPTGVGLAASGADGCSLRW